MSIYKKLIGIILIITNIALITPIFMVNARAASTQTKVIEIGPFQDNLAHDYPVKLPGLESVTSVTSDTGNVKVKSINGEDVTLTVQGGTPIGGGSEPSTKEIEVELPIPDKMQNVVIDSKENTAMLHYPRNENWFIWSQDQVTKEWRWATAPEGYREIKIVEEGDKVIKEWKSKQGEYVSSDGYKCKYSDFEQKRQEGWYPRDERGPGWITSTGREDIPCPMGEAGKTQGYKYIQYYTYDYSVHLKATGTKATGYMYKVTITYTTKEIVTPPSDNRPPECSISAPRYVNYGETVTIRGNASDPDGDTLGYIWTLSGGRYTEIPMEPQRDDVIKVMFSEIKDYNVELYVTDYKSGSDTDSKVITVLPPTPAVYIDKLGCLKENRKVVLSAEKSYSGSPITQIVWSKAKWEVTPVTPGITVNDIKCENGYIGNKSLNMVFKKPGKYKAKCELTNDLGYSDLKEIEFDIVPDEIPKANIYVPKELYRDSDDLASNGQTQAIFSITDDSSSPDGDIIEKRAYFFAFNSQNNKLIYDDNGNIVKKLDFKEINSELCIVETDINNKVIRTLKPSDSQYKVYYDKWSDLYNNFDDDQAYIYDLDYNNTENRNQMPWNHSINPHWRPICMYKDIKSVDITNINTGNLKSVELKSTHVGRYRFEAVVVEKFGQETIPQFITPQDQKKGNTFN